MSGFAVRRAAAGGLGAAPGPRPATRRLLRRLEEPGADFPRIVARAKRQPDLIPALTAGFVSASAPVRFGSAKTLSLLAAERPELVYPYFDFFLQQLDGRNSILRWNAARTLACLAPADRENKLEAALDKYLSPIPGPQMIAAANAIGWASTIALAKPRLANRIARAILGVSHAVYRTDECRNVAIGHAILSLSRFYGLITDKKAVLRFVRAQLENPRPATRAKALRFLGKHAGAGGAAQC